MTLKSKLDDKLWTEADSKLLAVCSASIWYKAFQKYGFCFDRETYKEADTTKPLISNIKTCITRKNKSYVFNK
jgi:hypothetical protein